MGFVIGFFIVRNSQRLQSRGRKRERLFVRVDCGQNLTNKASLFLDKQRHRLDVGSQTIGDIDKCVRSDACDLRSARIFPQAGYKNVSSLRYLFAGSPSVGLTDMQRVSTVRVLYLATMLIPEQIATSASLPVNDVPGACYPGSPVTNSNMRTKTKFSSGNELSYLFSNISDF